MASILVYAALLWYGVTGGSLALGIYASVYFGRLLDVTRMQLSAAFLAGIILSAISIIFHYFTSTNVPQPLNTEIIVYAVLTIGPIIIACLVYFLIVGRGNLRQKYNIDIRGLWPWEIRKLKEAHK